jgi:hypothetical protein
MPMRDWRPCHWILDENHVPVALEDGDAAMLTWARRFENHDNSRVAFTEIVPGVTVSTVFLGLDHSFGFGDQPLLFESMAFVKDISDWSGEEQDRYATWAEAQMGHNRMVEMIRARLREEVKGDVPQ